MQNLLGNDFGYVPISFGGSGNILALNTATTYLAQSFILSEDKTLSSLRHLISAITGTLANSNYVLEIRADALGFPSTTVLKTVTGCASTPSAGGMVEFTGIDLALSKGVRYWAVFKNANATPASNYPTYKIFTGVFQVASSGDYNSVWGWGKLQTTDGSAWATPISGAGGLLLKFSDNSCTGMPIINTGNDINVVQANKMLGVRFITGNSKLKVSGIAFNVNKSLTPNTGFLYKIYKDNTLIASTFPFPSTSNLTTTGRMIPLWVDGGSITLEPNTEYRVVLASSIANTDSGSTCYRVISFQLENTVDSLSLKPLNATMKRTYTLDSAANPITWVDSDDYIIPFALLLDNNDEFGVQCSASGGRRQSQRIPFVR